AAARRALPGAELHAAHRARGGARRAGVPPAGPLAEDRAVTPTHGRWLRAAITAVGVAALVACPAGGGDGGRATLIVFAYYAALAQMWNLLAGYAGLVTFGQQLFIGLGGYTLAVGA